jgi:hypothetical protein
MKKAGFLILLSFILLFGCATQKPLYYWGDYSKSLYKYKKVPSEENLKAYKVVLVNIIEESNKVNLRVPPGICCEYGYLLLKEGKKEEAIYYFNLEEKNYPESRQFLERFKTKFIEKKENQ